MKPNRFVITVIRRPAELNDELRGIKGDFDKVIDTVKRLRTIQDKRLQVVIGFTLTAGNGDVQGMIDQVRSRSPTCGLTIHMNVVHVSGHYYDNVETNAITDDLREDLREYRNMRQHKYTPIGFLEDRICARPTSILSLARRQSPARLAGSVFTIRSATSHPC
jgi:MoaA/NifB/PqqE/SkfB family radical SAM enzyme